MARNSTDGLLGNPIPHIPTVTVNLDVKASRQSECSNLCCLGGLNLCSSAKPIEPELFIPAGM